MKINKYTHTQEAHIGAESTDMSRQEKADYRALGLVWLAGTGTLAAALLVPFWFKTRHPVWGGLAVLSSLIQLGSMAR